MNFKFFCLFFFFSFTALRAAQLPVAEPVSAEDMEEGRLLDAMVLSNNGCSFANDLTVEHVYNPEWPLVKAATKKVHNERLKNMLLLYDPKTPRGYIPLLGALLEASAAGVVENVQTITKGLKQKEPIAFNTLINIPVTRRDHQHENCAFNVAIKAGKTECARHLLAEGAVPLKTIRNRYSSKLPNALENALRAPAYKQKELFVLLRAAGLKEKVFDSLPENYPIFTGPINHAAFWDYRVFDLLRKQSRCRNTYLFFLPQEILNLLASHLTFVYSATEHFYKYYPQKHAAKKEFDLLNSAKDIRKKIQRMMTANEDMTENVDPYHKPALVLLAEIPDSQDLIAKILQIRQPEPFKTRIILKALRRAAWKNRTNYEILRDYLHQVMPNALPTILQSRGGYYDLNNIAEDIERSHRAVLDSKRKVKESKLNVIKAKTKWQGLLMGYGLVAAPLLASALSLIGIARWYTIGYLKDGTPVVGTLLEKPEGDVIGYTLWDKTKPFYALSEQEQIAYPTAIGKMHDGRIIYPTNPALAIA